MKRALITGITGQDGSYLAELLLDKGYEVHGIVRRSSSLQHRAHRPPLPRPARAAACGCFTALRRPRATRVAARAPALRAAARRGLPPRRAEPRARLVRHPRVHVRRHRAWARCGCSRRSATRGVEPRFYQASSLGDVRRRAAAAERGDAVPPAQPVRRREGHGATGSTVNYREAYGMFAVNGILFNHESPAPRRDVRHPQDHPRAGRASRPGCRTSSTSATSTPSATGATRPTTPTRCGGCSSRTSPTTTSSPPARRTRVREFLEVAFAHARHRLGGRTSRSTERYFRPAEVDALLRRRLEGAREARLGADGHVQGARRGSWSTPTSRRSRTSSPAARCALQHVS